MKIERKTGFTLTELLVVVVVMALLVGVGVPAAKQLMASFETTSGVQNAIEAALSAARALAIKEQKYVGVRFQKIWRDYDADNAPHYMTFIIHDSISTNLTNGFRAVEGLKPIRLAENFGVMDLRIVSRVRAGTVVPTDVPVISDDLIDEPSEVGDCSSFSIVFSSSGKAVVQRVQTRNRDGYTPSGSNSDDDVFNTVSCIADEDDPTGQFVQDDYWGEGGGLDLGLGAEDSRNYFVIYDKKKFSEVQFDRRWSSYLRYLDVMYINPYSGEIINK